MTGGRTQSTERPRTTFRDRDHKLNAVLEAYECAHTKQRILQDAVLSPGIGKHVAKQNFMRVA